MTITARPACTALALLLTVVSGGCAAEQAPAGTSEPRVEFELSRLDGVKVSSSSYEGRVLLLEFWATWCGPCRAQAKILEPLYAEFRGRGVEFLAISLGEEAETVRRFADKNPFPYPVLLDPGDLMTERLGVYVLPTVAVVDRRGRIAYRQPGISPAGVLRQALEEAVGG